MAGCDATIYVRLLDEGVDVWRPLAARRVDGDLYRLSQGGYDGAIDILEFQPGDVVRVAPSADGTYLVAVARAGAS